MFVNLQIKSKNINSLKRFIQLLVQLNNSKKLGLKSILKYFSKKSQRKIFTILQSPHVNKTSQEQFEYNLKSIQLSINSLQFFKILVILKKLQKKIGFDIKLVTKLIINTRSKKKILLKNLYFSHYKVKSHNSKNLYYSSLKNYLNLLDIYGTLKFSKLV